MTAHQSTIPTLLLTALLATAAAGDWHHPFYRPGDGYWRARVSVTVENGSDRALEGTSVEVAPPLGGTPAEAVRLCDAGGTEMLFALTDARGKLLRTGPVPQGARLTIPVECPARGAARYYVYFDNPGAGEVPEMLTPLRGLVNGDVERDEGETPNAWTHDRADATHRASWSDENPQSGERCLKTVVAAGAEPTWISTRQHGVHIAPGAKYRLRGYVRAENVEGFAGWYIHVGNRQEPMMLGPVLRAGSGTFDWKPVELEFTAPAAADRADLGTVLRGTGTAWFDNLTLTQLTPGLVRAEVGPLERTSLEEHPAGAPHDWPTTKVTAGYGRRAVVRAFCFEKESDDERRAAVDLGPVAARARGGLVRDSLRVVAGEEPVDHAILGNTLLLSANLPPRSAGRWHVYFRDDHPVSGEPNPESADGEQAEQFAALVDGPRNLVANPSLERGDPLPEAWSGGQPAAGPDGVTFGLDDAGAPGMGRHSAKLHVPHGTAKNWRGWRQTVEVRPGRTYLVAGWVKTEDVRGKAQLHMHLHRADGKLCEEGAFRSAGPAIGGTTGWTLMSTTLRMPDDAARMSLHLTMDTTGTLRHDGLLVAEVLPTHVVRFEGRPVRSAETVAVWQVPALEKVFPDDPAGKGVRTLLSRGPFGCCAQDGPVPFSGLSIALARNEREPLQLAVRGGRGLSGVRVEVDPLRGPDGTALDAEVNVAGLVPVDHPTSYYRSLSPPWHRKIPHYDGRCDGWAGRWPDPLLPTDTFDVAANETRAVWVTVTSNKDTPPGRYVGKVRLVAGGKGDRTLLCPDQRSASVPASGPSRQQGPVPFSDPGGRILFEQEFVATVWDFALPDRGPLAAIYDVRVAGGRELWGGGLAENYRSLVEFLAERRLCADRIWPEPKIDYVEGRVVADFAEFDRAAEWYFDELKLPFSYTPRAFYLFGWAHPPKKKFGEQPYEGEPPWDDVDRMQLRPEYRRAYQACLKAFWDHVRERGWADRFVLYISEEPHFRHEHIRRQMEALCRMIHEVDPGIPIYSSTWHHVPDWDESLDVWGISHYGRVPVEQMEKLKKIGSRLWFTTDGQMCLDTPYCAVERLLPYYCFKYGVEAYEFWGAAWLTYNPYRFGWHAYIRQADRPGNYYWVRYPNGDGFLIYPGRPIGQEGPVSTVRLEQAREGVEDYEALCLLRTHIEQARSAGRDVSNAEAALKRATALIEIPNAGGRYSSRILPEPGAVYDVRQAVAEAIEELGQ